MATYRDSVALTKDKETGKSDEAKAIIDEGETTARTMVGDDFHPELSALLDELTATINKVERAPESGKALRRMKMNQVSAGVKNVMVDTSDGYGDLEEATEEGVQEASRDLSRARTKNGAAAKADAAALGLAAKSVASETLVEGVEAAKKIK